MITVIGIWELGFSDEQTFIEWRMWKQTVCAFRVDRWIMAGPQKPGGGFEPFNNLREALESLRAEDNRVFVMPGGAPKVSPPSHPAYIFGNSSNNLKRFVNSEAGDITLGIDTPQPTDMFAACCLPAVLL